MSAENQIGVREQQILTAIVETYIASGDPVGSRTISRAHHEQLSPATIRNVMADLADAGYLEQPHTSAGRIPHPKPTAITLSSSLDARRSPPTTKPASHSLSAA